MASHSATSSRRQALRARASAHAASPPHVFSSRPRARAEAGRLRKPSGLHHRDRRESCPPAPPARSPPRGDGSVVCVSSCPPGSSCWEHGTEGPTRARGACAAEPFDPAALLKASRTGAAHRGPAYVHPGCPARLRTGIAHASTSSVFPPPLS